MEGRGIITVSGRDNEMKGKEGGRWVSGKEGEGERRK
jgi:hypothetical protein